MAAAVLWILAAVLATCGGSSSPQSGGGSPQAGVNQGYLAVDFTLPALDGAEVSPSDYRGSVVLINFWATWCPPCRAEIPDIIKAYEARQGDGLVVLGIAVEQAYPLVAPFAEAIGMSYPVLLDEHGQVYKTYRTPGLPMSIFLDREGVIRVRHVGLMTGQQLDGYLASLLP